jgi:GNAT superfamily N-acetyltransferase
VLNREHEVAQFDCGNPVLNDWLAKIARQHQKNALSSSFVLIDDQEPAKVLGFYALAIRGLVHSATLPATMGKRLPTQVPGLTLARLAIASSEQKKGYGELLLLDAMVRAKKVSGQTGGYALFVDAKDQNAAQFYGKFGFAALPSSPLTMAIPIAAIAAA